MGQPPSYTLSDFVAACKDLANVYVSKGAMASAAQDFGLKTQADVIDFIAQGGLEKPIHANTAPWEHNPTTHAILVDSYGFYSGPKHGYIAFLWNPETKKWLVKSFKRNEQQDPRNLVFARLLGAGDTGKKP